MLTTQCVITLEDGVVTGTHRTLQGSVPGAMAEQFATLLKGAETNCPIFKALNTPIASEATLLHQAKRLPNHF